MHKAFPLLGESSHWKYKFPLPVEGVPIARRMEIPLPGVCTAMMKKLPKILILVFNKWIKGRSNNEGEPPAERISNDSKEIARVLTSIDAATILAGEANVPTGSGFIPTASPPATIVSTGSEVGPTASPIVQMRKGNEIMEQVKKQKSSEEAPESKTHTEEVNEDKIKEMMQLVPVEDVYVQAL
nr:hypothetical protein [Tanacetum cinerariifolium]